MATKIEQVISRFRALGIRAEQISGEYILLHYKDTKQLVKIYGDKTIKSEEYKILWNKRHIIGNGLTFEAWNGNDRSERLLNENLEICEDKICGYIAISKDIILENVITSMDYCDYTLGVKIINSNGKPLSDRVYSMVRLLKFGNYYNIMQGAALIDRTEDYIKNLVRSTVMPQYFDIIALSYGLGDYKQSIMEAIDSEFEIEIGDNRYGTAITQEDFNMNQTETTGCCTDFFNESKNGKTFQPDIEFFGKNPNEIIKESSDFILIDYERDKAYFIKDGFE